MPHAAIKPPQLSVPILVSGRKTILRYPKFFISAAALACHDEGWEVNNANLKEPDHA